MMAPVCLTRPAATPVSRLPGPAARSARLCLCRGLNSKVPSTCATSAACRPPTAARRWRRLLRADNLQQLSPADVTRLVRDFGLTTVIDLRSSAEVASEGPAPLADVPGVRHVHHPVMPELGSATDAVAEALLLRRDQAKSRFPDDPTCGHYLGYLEDRPDQVVGAVRSIAQDDGTALVHCAAGKDRTGVVVALALTAAGVRPEAVVADYAATSQRIEAILDRLRRSPTYARDIDNVPADAHRARPETMQAFLREVDTRYGGTVPWLTDHGLTAGELSLLRDKLRRSRRSGALPT